jgi:TRAP-type mannitol/chloroaromatic compound transport system permease large subunit
MILAPKLVAIVATALKKVEIIFCELLFVKLRNKFLSTRVHFILYKERNVCPDTSCSTMIS